MKVLGIDTSTLASTCGIIEDEDFLGEISYKMDMSHSENLIPMIDNLLENLKIDIEDIDLFAVSKGPGSFTGLRIGLATIKSFSHALDKPLVGVSTLEALAYNLMGNKIIIPMIDARRDRVYSGVYSSQNGELVNLREEEIYPIEEIIEIAKTYDDIVFTGTGTVVYKEFLEEKLKDKFKTGPISSLDCKGSSVAALGLNKYRQGQEDDCFSLSPEYFRKTKAQRDLEKKRG